MLNVWCFLNVLQGANLLRAWKEGGVACFLSRKCSLFLLKEDNTAVHLAAAKGHEDIVRFLLTNGADVSLENNLDKSPLEVAIDASEEWEFLSFFPITLQFWGRIKVRSHRSFAWDRKTAMVIMESEDWLSALRKMRLDRDGNRTSPFRMLIRRFPKVAQLALDK